MYKLCTSGTTYDRVMYKIMISYRYHVSSLRRVSSQSYAQSMARLCPVVTRHTKLHPCMTIRVLLHTSVYSVLSLPLATERAMHDCEGMRRQSVSAWHI